MAVALLYANTPKKAFVIEVKLAKISKYDADKIRTVHQKNIREGTEHIQSCTWMGEPVTTVQKEVVSGVWHPGATSVKAFELSSEFTFLDPIII